MGTMETEARGDALPKRRFELTKAGWFGVAMVIFWVVMAFVGPLIAPFDQADFVSDDTFLPVSGDFILGTDYLGRDILSRLLHGTQLTIGMAVVATLISTTVGSSFGLLSAIKGGHVDMVISRINDALMSFPTIMMGLVVIAALGSSIPILVCTTGLIYATAVFRIARALGMDIKGLDYIEVARARGESLAWILFQEVLPNAAMPLVVDFGIRLSFAILFMSSLSFLGLGVQPPAADWGSMVRENMTGLPSGSLASVFPALAIASLTIGLNLIVDDYAARSGRGMAKRMT
jgi:peptide/nickel transport system permease protein